MLLMGVMFWLECTQEEPSGRRFAKLLISQDSNASWEQLVKERIVVYRVQDKIGRLRTGHLVLIA